MQVVFSVNNQGEKTAPQQADIADETMFERLNDSDGICQYYVEDQVHASRWPLIHMRNPDNLWHRMESLI